MLAVLALVALERGGAGYEAAGRYLLVAVLASFIEWMRLDSSLPWWYSAAHGFSLGLALLVQDEGGPGRAALALGLCAAGAPFLWRIYRAGGARAG